MKTLAARTATVKIWKTTISNLRMIYAITGRPMVEIMERLAKAELERLKGKGDKPTDAKT